MRIDRNCRTSVSMCIRRLVRKDVVDTRYMLRPSTAMLALQIGTIRTDGSASLEGSKTACSGC